MESVEDDLRRKGERNVARKRARKKSNGKLKRAGVSAYNKPKRTPKHRTKSHVVVAKVGKRTKTI